MSVPALHISNLHKSYGGTPALTGFSLDIAPGEFCGLVGENGAGKTTLIKCALDFCDVQSGHVEIFGVPHRQTAARSRLAFLPERFMPPNGTRSFQRMLDTLASKKPGIEPFVTRLRRKKRRRVALSSGVDAAERAL